MRVSVREGPVGDEVCSPTLVNEVTKDVRVLVGSVFGGITRVVEAEMSVSEAVVLMSDEEERVEEEASEAEVDSVEDTSEGVMVLVLVDSGWIVEVVAKIDVEVAVSVITDTENTVDTLPVCSVLVDVVLGDSVDSALVVLSLS